MHRQIVRYFGDTLNRLSPFSVQTLVGIGRKLGRNPGDWYGPASISNVLRLAESAASTRQIMWINIFCVLVANGKNVANIPVIKINLTLPCHGYPDVTVASSNIVTYYAGLLCNDS